MYKHEIQEIEEKIIKRIYDSEVKSSIDSLKLKAFTRLREAINALDWQVFSTNSSCKIYKRSSLESDMLKCEMTFMTTKMDAIFEVMKDLEWERQHKTVGYLNLIEDNEEYRDWYAKIKVPKPWFSRDIVFRRHHTYNPEYSQLIGFSIQREDMPKEHNVVRVDMLRKLS